MALPDNHFAIVAEPRIVSVTDEGVGECVNPEGNGVNPGEGDGGEGGSTKRRDMVPDVSVPLL
jgi:hypothetical protein